MQHEGAAVCSCGCDQREVFETQLICAECGRTVSDFELQPFQTGSVCLNPGEKSDNFVHRNSDGSSLCAPSKRRPPSRLHALKTQIEYLGHLLMLPHPVLVNAEGRATALCARQYQTSSGGSRACVALFVACKEEAFPMTLRSLCQWMSVGVPETLKCLKTYNQHAQVPCTLVEVHLYR